MINLLYKSACFILKTIRKYMYIIIPTYLMLTCCSEPTAIFNPNIDKELVEYVEMYRKLKREYLDRPYYDNITIEFRVLESPTVGQCRRSGNKRYIYIDYNYWYREFTTEEDRIILFLHEMGHCDLTQTHREDSIMSEFVFSDKKFRENEDFYLQEFFGVNDE